VGTTRCSECVAPYSVRCSGNRLGQVRAVEQVRGVRVQIFNSTTGVATEFDLPQISGTLESLNTPERNPAIMAALRSRGTQVNGQQINLSRVTFASGPPAMFQDMNARTPLAPPAQAPAPVTGGTICAYHEQPIMISPENCANQSYCTGQATCYENGRLLGGRIQIACRSVRGRCPSATACAADEAISPSTPNDQPVQFPNDLPRSQVVPDRPQGVAQ
jgi:hypothetical protein